MVRHSCATLLLASGENIKVIQERLGHADVNLTLSTYSHVLDGMQAAGIGQTRINVLSKSESRLKR